MADKFLTFSSPAMLLAALAVTAAAALVVLIRPPAIPRLSLLAIFTALVLVALAAAQPTIRWPARHEVLVMVDLSPSTRTAQYRNPHHLHQRIEQLLGRTPYRVLHFAESVAQPSATQPPPGLLADLPARRTIFSPPTAPALLLFSDGRFETPAFAPPTYVAIDPDLERPPDASIQRLEQHDDQITVTVHNTGPPRQLILTGTRDPSPITVPTGTRAITRPILPDATMVLARIDRGDVWPENDALTLHLARPIDRERWWVSDRPPPPQQWTHLTPGQFPSDPLAYLAPAVIVLDNLAADRLTGLQLQRLEQYVRDLGGGLLLIGGDRAFAAGGYPGTPLEALSPLASLPPQPTTHWMLLADSSGSMAAVSQGQTRWQHAAGALDRLTRELPEHDLLSVGNFARELRWWSYGRSAAETRAMPFPPAGLFPHGPTNLQPALQRLAAEAEPDMTKHLLVLTDAEVEIDRPDQLARILQDHNIHLHILAIEDGGGIDRLRQLAQDTGGSFQREIDPGRWSAAVSQLMRAALPQHLHHEPLHVRFTADAAHLPARSVRPWNRTWTKPAATALAVGSHERETGTPAPGPVSPVSGSVEPAARWRLGAGQVLAVAFAADFEEAHALAQLIAQPPRDPRLQVSWQTAPDLRVTVDAADERQYLNELPLQLQITSPPAAGTHPHQVHDLPQTAPGRYELALPAPEAPMLVSLSLEGRLVDRIPLAGRYPPEFNAVGNDRSSLHRLAQRTAGRVIEPRDTRPIDFEFPPRPIRLTAPLATLAALSIALALIWWRRA